MKPNHEKEAFFVSLVKSGILIVSDDGVISNPKTGKIYSRRMECGYIQLAVKRGGRVLHMLAHRLVYLVKNGPLHGNEQVNHLDGVKWNNRPSNLEKTSNSGNMLHAYATGLIKPVPIRHGERAGYLRGCRCAPCVSAKRAYMNEYNREYRGAGRDKTRKNYLGV